jgi:hypothetical protein
MRSRGLLALATAAALGLAVVYGLAGAGAPPSGTIEISAHPITAFRIGSDQTRFGPLEFVGGLELTARPREFGQLSAIRFFKPGSEFIGVADIGFWFFGRITRNEAYRPTGFAAFRMARIRDEHGQPIEEKFFADAEGLAVKNGIATIGFEREHRIAQYKIDPEEMGPAIRHLDFLVPKRELRQNKGFETVAHAHPRGRHEGGLVVITERSIDTQGNIFAAIIEGPNKGVFTVRRSGDFDITDGAFLPDGDLLLLERRFSMATGVAMRLRRIHAKTIAKGMVADGPVLLEADMGYQIDNMEGLDVWRREDGALIVSVISDDNQSMLQRNIYLEFRLVE